MKAGNLERAVAAYYECLKLVPESVVAARGLARAARDLGKLDVAVRTLETALRFNPKDGRLLADLGAGYLELGTSEQAIEILELAMITDSQNVDAAFNLGNAYRGIGDKTKALAAYRQAAAIKPSDSDVQSTLGMMLVEQGRIEEGVRHYENAHLLGDSEALFDIGMALIYGDDDQAVRNAFERAITDAPDSWPSLASSALLALILYLAGDTGRSLQHLQRATPLLPLAEAGPRAQDIRNMKAYYLYLDMLLSSQPVTHGNVSYEVADTLHLVGDSHVIGLKDAIIPYQGKSCRTEAHWILGCKQWHLGRDEENKYKRKFSSIAAGIPREAAVLLSIGEIDCRFGGGIVEFLKKKRAGGNSLQDVALNTIGPYIKYVRRQFPTDRHQVILCGVPAPHAQLGRVADEQQMHAEIVRYFNASLQRLCSAEEMGFLDLHALTDAGQGLADGSWHADPVHLKAEAYIEAFQKHYHPANF